MNEAMLGIETEQLKEQIVALALEAFDPKQQFIGTVCQAIGYGKEQFVARPEKMIALRQATLKLIAGPGIVIEPEPAPKPKKKKGETV